MLGLDGRGATTERLIDVNRVAPVSKHEGAWAMLYRCIQKENGIECHATWIKECVPEAEPPCHWRVGERSPGIQ
jgi:hypothetical protein